MGKVAIEKCPVCDNANLTAFAKVQDHSVSGETFQLVKCTKCELRITQDHPDSDSIGPYYASEDYISHSDTKKGLINSLYHKVRDHMLSKKQQLVEKYCQSGTLLDFGTGTGYFIDKMSRAGWDVLGLEPDEGARAYTKREFGLDTRHTDTLHELSEHQFDVVTMWHVLEHVHNLNSDLDKIAEVVKPGGILIIAVPNPLSADAKSYGPEWAAYDVPRHLWHFSPKSIKTLVAKKGFDLKEIQGMPFDAFYVAMLSEKYKKSSLGLVRGGLAGLSTNVQAFTNTEKASSLIYVAQKRTS